MKIVDQISLRHASYINIRAIVLGGSIGFGLWYLVHHASQFGTIVSVLLTVVTLGTLWTSHFAVDKLYRLNYLIVPLVLFGSALFFFLLLKNPTYQLYFCIGLGAIYIFFFRAFTELREHPTPERKKSLTQSLDVVTTITMFLALASLQELYFFFAWRLYWLALATVLLSGVLLYAIYWHHRVMTLRAWFYVALGTLVMSELVLAINLLPTGYLTNALLAVIGLFLYQALTVAALRGLLRRRVVIEQSALACVVTVIALVTSRWTPLS